MQMTFLDNGLPEPQTTNDSMAYQELSAPDYWQYMFEAWPDAMAGAVPPSPWPETCWDMFCRPMRAAGEEPTCRPPSFSRDSASSHHGPPVASQSVTTTATPKETPLTPKPTDAKARPTTLNTVLRSFRCPKDLSDWADVMATTGHAGRRYTWTMICTLALNELKTKFTEEASRKAKTPGMGRTVQKQLPLKKGSR